VNAADARGRLPGHVAGPAGARALLAAAAAANVLLDRERCDDSGCSVDDALYLALREGEELEEDEGEEAAALYRRAFGGDYEGLGAAPPPPSEESAWRERLAEVSGRGSADLAGG